MFYCHCIKTNCASRRFVSVISSSTVSETISFVWTKLLISQIMNTSTKSLVIYRLEQRLCWVSDEHLLFQSRNFSNRLKVFRNIILKVNILFYTLFYFYEQMTWCINVLDRRRSIENKQYSVCFISQFYFRLLIMTYIIISCTKPICP